MDCLSYWSSSEKVIISIFNSKAENVLATSSTFLHTLILTFISEEKNIDYNGLYKNYMLEYNI